MARSEGAGGFTLPELLVVVVVLGLLAALSFGAEREGLARQQVEVATRRVLQGLERGRLRAERSAQACVLRLEPAGWTEPEGGALPACRGAALELGEGVGAVPAAELEHNLPAAVRFSSNGLVLDGGTVLVRHRHTALVRCVVVALPLGITRVGVQAADQCRPDPQL